MNDKFQAMITNIGLTSSNQDQDSLGENYCHVYEVAIDGVWIGDWGLLTALTHDL